MNTKHAMINGHPADIFAAEMTRAVYGVALRHGTGAKWLELELGLWNAVVETMNQWERRPPLSTLRAPVGIETGIHHEHSRASVGDWI
jgi:hypothetical protein